MNAIGICGLQLYRYGETVSIPFFTETWRPDSFYEKIQRNRNLGLHTLCLLGELLIFVWFELQSQRCWAEKHLFCFSNHRYSREGTLSGIFMQVCFQVIELIIICFLLSTARLTFASLDCFFNLLEERSSMNHLGIWQLRPRSSNSLKLNKQKENPVMITTVLCIQV